MKIGGWHSKWWARHCQIIEAGKTGTYLRKSLARVNDTFTGAMKRKVNDLWGPILVFLDIRLGTLNLICRHWRTIKNILSRNLS